MSRIQIALNVSDINSSIAFYSKLFGVQPAKVRPGYANFAIAEPPLKLVLIEGPDAPGTLNHLGVEVTDIAQVQAGRQRMAEADMAIFDEGQTTCCYAEQDKFWVQGAPDGERWEVYTVLDDAADFGTAPQHAAAPASISTSAPAEAEPGCCAPTAPAKASSPANASAGNTAATAQSAACCAPQ